MSRKLCKNVGKKKYPVVLLLQNPRVNWAC